MHRSLRTLLATATVALPAGAAWVLTRPSATATQAAPEAPAARATATAVPHKTSAHKSTTHKTTRRPTTKPTAHRYAGPVEDMQWGPVQVTLVVTGKRITDVQASAPMERPRSAFINQQAIPWLRQEVLQAQSANINAISGATMTSEAFYLSLQGALKAAHL